MKRILISIFTILALAGIINCTLVEPAFAYKDDPAVAQEEESHCCSLCHSMHHQWVNPEDFENNLFPPVCAETLIAFIPSRIDPPAGSIFHPPIYA